MLEQFIHPLFGHDQAPLTILEVLLALISQGADLLDHALNLVGMKRVEDFEEKVPLRQLAIVVGQVLTDEWPIPDLPVDILDVETWPVRHCLCRDLLLLQYSLLPVQDALQEDELALAGFW